MKRKKLLPLCGKEFEVCNSLYTPGIKTRRSLWDVYEKPSELKVEIYNDLIAWFCYCSENDNDFITIDTYSNQIFTLSGVVTVNGESYAIKVTPSHNYCVKLNRELITIV